MLLPSWTELTHADTMALPASHGYQHRPHPMRNPRLLRPNLVH
jgi:hypothetical protein